MAFEGTLLNLEAEIGRLTSLFIKHFPSLRSIKSIYLSFKAAYFIYKKQNKLKNLPINVCSVFVMCMSRETGQCLGGAKIHHGGSDEDPCSAE